MPIDPENLRYLTDAELAEAIARASGELPPTPPPAPPGAPTEWTKLKVTWPSTRIPVSLRLDEVTLAWFRAQGPGYQARINAVLRAFVEAQLAAAPPKRHPSNRPSMF